MPRLISMSAGAKLGGDSMTWPSILNQTKLVTRREGWWDFTNSEPSLRDGEQIEATQWSLRIPWRWVCTECGALGSTKRETGGACVPCLHDRDRALIRSPQRGIFLRHLSSRREPLSAITSREVALEGFPGKLPGWFIQMAFPGKGLSHMVTRIRFEYVNPPDSGGLH